MKHIGCAAALALALLILFAGCSAPDAAPPIVADAAPIQVSPSAEPTPSPSPTPRTPSVTMQQETADSPYPLPQITGEYDPEDLTTPMLDAMVRRYCFDLFDTMRTLEKPDFSSYVEDNAHTRLAARWPEFYIADIKKTPRRQVIAITSVSKAEGRREQRDGAVFYSVMCEVRYDRKDPSVNGCNVDTQIEVAERDGKLKIIAIDLGFDSRYRDLLAKIEQDAGGWENVTVERIDKAFDALIK